MKTVPLTVLCLDVVYFALLTIYLTTVQSPEILRELFKVQNTQQN